MLTKKELINLLNEIPDNAEIKILSKSDGYCHVEINGSAVIINPDNSITNEILISNVLDEINN